MYNQQYSPQQMMAGRIQQLLQSHVIPTMIQQGQLYNQEVQYLSDTLNSGLLVQLANAMSQPQVGVDSYGRQMQYAARQYTDSEVCQFLWSQIGNVIAHGRQNNVVPQYVNPQMMGMQQPPMGYGYGQAPMGMVHPTNGGGGMMQSMSGQGMISPTSQNPLSNLYGSTGSIDGNMVYPSNITPNVEVHSGVQTVKEYSNVAPTTNAMDIAKATNTSQLMVSQQRNEPTLTNNAYVNAAASEAAGMDILSQGVSDASVPEINVTASRQPSNPQLDARKEMLTSAGVQICRDIAMYNTSSGNDVLYTVLEMQTPYSSWYTCKKDLYTSEMTPRMQSIGSNYATVVAYKEMTPVYIEYDSCTHDLNRLMETRKAIQPNLAATADFLTALNNVSNQSLKQLLHRRFVSSFNDMARVWLLIGDDTYNNTYLAITEPNDITTFFAPEAQRLPEIQSFVDVNKDNWQANLIRCAFAAINAICRPNVKCYLDMDDIDDQLVALSVEDSGIRYQGMNGRQISYNYEAEQGIPPEVITQLKRKIVLIHEKTVIHTRLVPVSNVIQLQPNEALSYENTKCALDQICMDYFKNTSSIGTVSVDFLDVNSIGRDDISVGKTINGRISYTCLSPR